MAITRTSFAKGVGNVMNTFFGLKYDRWPEEYSKVFEIKKSKGAFEEQTLISGFGYGVEKSEGGDYFEDGMAESWTQRYTNRTIALACVITEEAIEDNRYINLSEELPKALATSLRQTIELYHANVLNNATDSGYLGGDGKPLLATDHPLQGGGTFSNTLTAQADLSESSLEQITIQIRECKDERGLPAMIVPKRLVTGAAGEYDAIRILASTSRVGTADNDANALREKGVYGNAPLVMTHISDPDAWFVTTNCDNGLVSYVRTPVVIPKVIVRENGDILYRVKFRGKEGWTNPRGVFGSMGA